MSERAWRAFFPPSQPICSLDELFWEWAALWSLFGVLSRLPKNSFLPSSAFLLSKNEKVFKSFAFVKGHFSCQSRLNFVRQKLLKFIWWPLSCFFPSGFINPPWTTFSAGRNEISLPVLGELHVQVSNMSKKHQIWEFGLFLFQIMLMVNLTHRYWRKRSFIALKWAWKHSQCYFSLFILLIFVHIAKDIWGFFIMNWRIQSELQYFYRCLLLILLWMFLAFNCSHYFLEVDASSVDSRFMLHLLFKVS